MPVILRFARISQLLFLSQVESYLSILKLLTAEALKTYSIWSISHLFMGFFYSQTHHPYTQDKLDLIRMHIIFLNIFSKYALCNNHITLINLSLLVSLNSITRSFTKIFHTINWGHKILIIVWHLYWEVECHLHNYLVISVIVLLAILSSQCLR
jgi:hypothetical protein